MIVIKMGEGAIPPTTEGSSGSDISDDDNNESVVSMDEVLARGDDILVGPIQLSIELWRRKDGVYLDKQLVGHS